MVKKINKDKKMNAVDTAKKLQTIKRLKLMVFPIKQ